MSNDDAANRRGFLRQGIAVTIVGVGSWRSIARAVIAESQQNGKTPLSEKTLNGALTVPPPPPNARVNLVQAQQQLASSVRRNPKDWVRSKFTLTPDQEESLNSISRSKWKELDDLLLQAEKNGGRLSVKILPNLGNSTIPPNKRNNFLPAALKPSCKEIKIDWNYLEKVVSLHFYF